MAEDPLANLPRLGDEAMGPCACCGKQLLETALPMFYRVRMQTCGIDGKAVRERMGLAATIGRGEVTEASVALAGIMGPGTKPVIVMNEGKDVNFCATCVVEKGAQLFLLIEEE